jgi:phage terminase small subunit
MEMADKLTIKQEKYVQGLFAGLSQREAYKQAYNCKKMKDKTIDENASRLANDSKVKARLRELTEEFKNRNMLTVEWVLNNLKEVTERCLQQEPVKDRQGNETGEYTFQANGANRALELIGKHLGMFTDKVEMTGKDGGPIEIKTMKDEEIDQQIQEMQERLGLTCKK